MYAEGEGWGTRKRLVVASDEERWAIGVRPSGVARYRGWEVLRLVL